MPLTKAKVNGRFRQVDEESFLLGMKKMAEMLNESAYKQNSAIKFVFTQIEAEMYRTFIPIMEDALERNRVR